LGIGACDFELAGFVTPGIVRESVTLLLPLANLSEGSEYNII
jgi:hypothetical protein